MLVVLVIGSNTWVWLSAVRLAGPTRRETGGGDGPPFRLSPLGLALAACFACCLALLLLVTPLLALAVGQGSGPGLWLAFVVAVCMLASQLTVTLRVLGEPAGQPAVKEPAGGAPPVERDVRRAPRVEEAGAAGLEEEKVAAEREEIEAEERPLPASDCLIDRELWDELKAELGRQKNEQGGFALGYRQQGHSFITAVVLPANGHSSSTYCEYPTRDLDLVRQAMSALEGLSGSDRLATITAWVHTHPHLGVFLSGTDRATLKQWGALDRNARAIVVDAYKGGFSEQIQAFDAQCNKVTLETGCAAVPEQLRDRFRRAIQEVYEAEKRPLPELIFASTS
jgi:proteasome lid subunit RPN8/RPN11